MDQAHQPALFKGDRKDYSPAPAIQVARYQLHSRVTSHTHLQAIVKSTLFSPLTLRNVTLRNRIVISPVRQYCAHEGLANDWHLVHYGKLAQAGAGMVMLETTAVESRGRVTYGDLGLWSNDQVEPLGRIASFIKARGAVPGIRLGHAGRKAAMTRPWEGHAPLLSRRIPSGEKRPGERSHPPHFRPREVGLNRSLWVRIRWRLSRQRGKRQRDVRPARASKYSRFTVDTVICFTSFFPPCPTFEAMPVVADPLAGERIRLKSSNGCAPSGRRISPSCAGFRSSTVRTAVTASRQRDQDFRNWPPERKGSQSDRRR
ncbi:Putative NADH-flavinoxidoreductase [Paraburkholderia xenovorans LB400]|uniref:NADH-flavinoxidoreductase n=1 Tax=Paraburkholderia xenovorans (strain LB400) TaxID=266265 RepID=Q140Z7_PARXL|nr:Putative NADH-flavinoxidoreductase [Paraburkholderia xenovorans LB400]